MNSDEFLEKVQNVARSCDDLMTSDDRTWVIKGFIDVARNIYVMPGDTKVVSKVIELMLLPTFAQFATDNQLRMMLPTEQNHYPDLTFIDNSGNAFAVDLKTTYRVDSQKANTMTLGAFTGYFRNRDSTKNTTLAYGSYKCHIVFGVLYTRLIEALPEEKIFRIQDLERMPSAISELQFFAQPKYRIAKDSPGSGNTKNIGAIANIAELLDGRGPFTALGEKVFDSYWMGYMTKDMAKALELPEPPYNNLVTYQVYKDSL